MNPLCVGLPAQWWSPEDDGARLATAICRRCAGCPDNDPAPAGVIRQGVPYSDAGTALPLCPACGRPIADYPGGPVNPCRRCSVPNVAIPNVKASRRRWVVALARRGMPTAQIAAETGLSVKYVRELRGPLSDLQAA